MEQLGEELYGIIHQCYPELAPKLTGMILSMGEEECVACLESQEHLAECLDEAFRILDVNGQCTKEQPPEEKRTDPEDGKARTFTELRALCASRYTIQEIEEYWKTMQPQDGAAAGAKAKPAAPAAATAKPAAKSSSNSAAPAPKPAGAAPAQKAPKPPPEPEPAGEDGVGPLPGLDIWLRELKLDPYQEAAAQWVEEQGPATLDEVVENLEDFAAALSLKKLEHKRLMTNGEAAAKVAMEAAEKAAAERAAAAAASSSGTPAADPAFQAELEEARREQEELARELEELKELEKERPRGAAKPSTGPKAKAPSVRVAPKAAPMSREELEWRRENEKQDAEYQKRMRAKQAATDADEASRAAEEKRQAKAAEAEERQQRAAEQLAAQVAAAGGPEASPADDFPSLGGDWAAAGGKKKGKKLGLFPTPGGLRKNQ